MINQQVKKDLYELIETELIRQRGDQVLEIDIEEEKDGDTLLEVAGTINLTELVAKVEGYIREHGKLD